MERKCCDLPSSGLTLTPTGRLSSYEQPWESWGTYHAMANPDRKAPCAPGPENLAPLDGSTLQPELYTNLYMYFMMHI